MLEAIGRELGAVDAGGHWQTLVETAPDVIMTLARDGTILFVNRLSPTLGNREVIGSPAIAHLAEAHRQRLEEALAKVFDGGGSVHIELMDRSQVWWSVRMGPVWREGQVKAALLVARDITETKRIADALDASRQELQAILDNMLDTYYRLDLGGRVRRVSPSVVRLLGYRPEEVDGLPLQAFYGGSDDVWPRLCHDLEEAGGELRGYELPLKRRDGTRIWAALTARHVKDCHGTACGVEGTAADVTARRETEQQLRESRERLRDLSAHLQEVRENEKAEIAREIHDELGSTLTALNMHAVWLEQALPEEAGSLREKVAAMASLVDAAVGTVRRIVSELRPTVLDDLGLAAAIEWQAGQFSRHTGIPCTADVACDDRIVPPGAALVLFRVVQESLTNVARHARADKVRIDFWAEERTLLLTVEDNGIGIDPAAPQRVESHGIRGMRERLAQWDGTLEVHGAPGAGTMVTVRLPLRRNEEAAP